MADPRQPSVPAPVAAVARTAFRAAAALRGGQRVLHPHGAVFEAELFLAGDERSAEGSLLGLRTNAPAIARLSRAVGVPEPLPDALGIAIAVSDLGERGSRQDLLFTTASRLPGARHVPLPAPRGFFGHTFTSLWPYRVGGKLRMLALQPEERRRSPAGIDAIALAAPGARYRLLIAELEAPWQALGELTLRDRIRATDGDDLRFNPWQSADGELRPIASPLMRVRDQAYRGSQQGRGADPEV